MSDIARPDAPIDTTDDPELEARWQALVQEVIDAKAAAAQARDACVRAEKERGDPRTASPEQLAAVDAAHEAYAAAGARVARASEAMKTGRL